MADSSSRAAVIRQALDVFLGQGQVTELRAWAPDGQVMSGAFYRDLDLMASRAVILDRSAGGVYFIPNPLRPDLVPAGKTHAPGNANASCVASRRWLLCDSDPFRYAPDGVTRLTGAEAKVPSTDQEKKAAWALIEGARELCEGAGASGGVMGDSGNGYHLCYPLDLPADQVSYALVDGVLAGLQSRLCDQDSRAEIDQKTKDAPRVWKLYGTAARKGPAATPERPFRYSSIIEGGAWDQETAKKNNEAFGNLAAAWRAQDEVRQPKQQKETVGTIERARRYLEKEEIAVQGSNGSKPCFHVACICVQGFALSDGDALAAMQDWNARCNPPWPESQLLHKIADARKAPSDRPFGYLLNATPNGTHAGSGGKAQHAPPPKNGTSKGPTPALDKLLIRASEVEPKAVEWLWPGRIALGKMTTFAGLGGIGKTFVLLDIAARVTTGAAWPDGAANGIPGDVIFISGEDDVDDTLVPRLIEMGADLSRVHFLTDEAQAAFHMGRTDLLEAFVQAAGSNVRLIVIDPPTSYLAGVDDHKNAELRQVLTPIKNLASRLRCSVVFNTHVNKGGAGKVEAMMRVMGSVAWVNAVRVACLFARDPEDHTGERRLFIGMKVNIGKERKGLAYRIASTTGDLARIEWLGEVSTTADQAVNRERSKPRGVVASEWLAEQMGKQREWPSNDLIRAARENGISRDALFEAKERLELPKPKKRVHSNGDVVWVWWVADEWQPPKSKCGEPPESTSATAMEM